MRIFYYEASKCGIFRRDGQIVVEWHKKKVSFVLTFGDLETKKRYTLKDLDSLAPETKNRLTPILKVIPESEAPEFPAYLEHKLWSFALKLLKHGEEYIHTLPRVTGDCVS